MTALPVFPTLPGVNFPVARTGPIFDTVRQKAVSGRETTYSKRITPQWQWTLGFDLLRSDAGFAELQTLAGFIASVYGQAQCFAYTDAEDNAVTTQPFGQGDGTTTQFQLVRSYGGFAEPVLLPTESTVTIFVGGVVQAGPVTQTIDYGLASAAPTATIDYGLASVPATVDIDYGAAASAYSFGTSGLISFTTPPAAAVELTWTGSFAWLCRLDADSADFSKMWASNPQNSAGAWELKKLAFTSVIP